MSVHQGHPGPYRVCQHPDCKAAKLRYNKRWRHEVMTTGRKRLIDAGPVRLHVATLEGHGWSRRAIAGAADIAPQVITALMRHRRPFVQRATAAKILAVRPDQVPSRPSQGSSEPFVPRVGTVRRIQALLRMGWSHEAMRAHSGLRTAVLLHQQGRWVTRSTHERVAAMYRDLASRPGPSERTRQRAERLGYCSPAEWDNIDLDAGPDDLDVAI